VTSNTATLLRVLPKIELHRHLEGSVRLHTLIDIAKQHKIDLPAYDVEGLRSHVQITADSPLNSTHFLSKFNLLRRFYYSAEVIKRVTTEAIEDAAADNIRYMELRFTPKALSKLMGFSFEEVIRWVIEATNEAQQGRNIKVRLIVSMNRHESVKEGELAVRAAYDFRDKGIVAVDLAGQENGFAAAPFFDLFKEAKQSGFGITVHAGEWAGAANVQDAIIEMSADRIGHGVRVVEDHRVVKLALERGTAFEVCPTSNIQSGAVVHGLHHPLADMLRIGLRTTLNTDDPSISGITLSDELVLSAARLGLSVDEIKQTIMNAANAAFLPESERQDLIRDFNNALALIGW
jgi:adenosine deaminase